MRADAFTWSAESIRELERGSIRRFVEACAEYFTGRVLDLGCGKQPYRDVIETAGGDYVGYDRTRFPANVSGADVGLELAHDDLGTFDAILTTQTIQYVTNPGEWLTKINALLAERGVLVMTGPTTWPVVEVEDLRRFTAAGVTAELRDAGFADASVWERAPVEFGPGLVLPLGWQAVAHA